MSNIKAHTIYTIGHSTHTMEEFMEMLKSFNIQTLVDIRSLPGSRKFPQFDKENMEVVLPQNGVQYIHMLSLGGRRKVKKDSHNTRWRKDSFRGYADYMETPEFASAVKELEKIAKKTTTVYMCAEAVWWRCHRSMVSDYLKAEGWYVLHIMSKGKAQEHHYTEPAVVKDGHVCYAEEC